MKSMFRTMCRWLGFRKARPERKGGVRRRFLVPAIEQLEDRCLLAFSVANTDVFANGSLRLVADFNQAVNSATVQADDLMVDGSQAATAVNVLDADSVEFILPALSAGTHSLTIAAGAISDTGGTAVDPFSRSVVIASAAQLVVNHNPRLQPGNAPLTGFAGSTLDRVDVLWQTIPGGAGIQDAFVVSYRASGASAWQTASLNAAIDTGVEGRVVRSATVTGLNWNSDYEYRVRHFQADVIVGQYQSTFHTRLQAGDQSAFTFAAYGDAASGTSTGFREVQDRINQMNPSFAVLLGDNIYEAGSHQESDARFDPDINPEAAAWMAAHIDYLGLGNHDIGTASGLPSEQNYSVPIPVAGVTAPAAPPATERGEHNYSWDYGDVHFITFDTNSLSDATRLDGLLNWVVTDLNASTARWKIVYGHHPLAGVPDKPESPSDNYYQQVVNRLKGAGVDLFMTGHSHTYSWTYPLTGQINGTATYVNHGVDDQFIAGEGLPQLVSGVGGKELRDGDYNQFPFVAEGFTSTTAVPSRHGFAQIGVTHNQLTVSYVAADNGAVIDSFTISKDDTVQTATFQQGVNGYTGTVDTFLHQNAPTTSNATATSLKVDNDDPAGTGNDAQTLLRFNNLFGTGAGQIPTNAILRSATLQLQVTNNGNSMNLHRMLSNWAATDTWNTLVGGVQANGVEAVAAPDTSTGTVPLNVLSFNVLSSLQAWLANPTTNRGWAFLPTGTDGVDFNSSEGAIKPKLIVTYVLAPNSPPVAVNDTATTNGGTPVAISVLGNDSDPNGDPLVVQSATQPAHGTTVVNANSTITYTPAAGYFGPDSFSYTISDGHGGNANANVTVTVVQTVSFQQGVNGYSGTVDTFLQQNTPAATNSAATALNVDSDDPVGTGLDVQALLRFNNLFGGGAGQIPAGATLSSATLQLQVTNSGNSMNLHRMLTNWAATDTWSSLGNGVQNDGLEAVATADVASGTVAVGVFSINVLSSLQAWLASPTSNRGWVFLPTGTDGIDFFSAEGTTPPKLIVSYIPNTPPTISDIADQFTNEDTPTGALAFTVGDIETPAGSLVVTATSSNAALVPNANLVLGGSGANRTLTATPALNQFGTTTITVTVTDSSGATANDTFVLTVNAVNDPPTVSDIADQSTNEDTSTGALAFTVGDIETAASALTVTATSSNAALVPNANLVLGGGGANRTLTATPASNQFGTATITVTVTDADGATAMDTFVLTVNAVNDPPTISDIADQSTNEDTPTGALAFTVGDVETPAASLIVTATSSNPALVPNANLVFGGSGANRALTATPAANQFGTTTITVTVTDSSGATANDTFVLTVNAVNDPPTISDIANQTIAENTSTSPLAFTVSDIETPTASLIVTATSSNTMLVPNANLVLGGSGASRTLKVTPAVDQTGTTTIVVTVADGSGATTTDTFVLTVLSATKFFVVDSADRSTYRYSAAGTYLAEPSLAAGNTNPRGIAANPDGSRLWVLDHNKTVYVYTAALTLLGSWTPSGLKEPTGISVSGADVWIVDISLDKVLVYAGAASRLSGAAAATRSFALAAGNNNPQDLVTDGTTVWVVQSGGTDKVFVYQASAGASLGNWNIDAANGSPTGITLDPTGASNSLWIVDKEADMVFEYANARARLSGSQTASITFALNSANRDAQGIADPPSMMASPITTPGTTTNALVSARHSDRSADHREMGRGTTTSALVSARHSPLFVTDWLLPTAIHVPALIDWRPATAVSFATRERFNVPSDSGESASSTGSRRVSVPDNDRLEQLDDLFMPDLGRWDDDSDRGS